MQEELTSEDLSRIRSSIRKKYAKVAFSAKDKFSYPTGKEGVMALNYDPADIGEAPPALLETFCGVGNPFSLGGVEVGTTILDVGCGAGLDLFIACRQTGERGWGYGIDLSEEMASRARENLVTAGINNFTVKKVNTEKLPFPDGFFGMAISNAAINLSPCKQILFDEIFRVLRPGGKIQFADVILEGELLPQLIGSPEAWAQ